MSDRMYDMGNDTVSIRELQQNLKSVMGRVERGETIEVTRHRRPVARLAPVRATGPTEEWPDLEARTRAVFGDRVLPSGGVSIIIEGRGDR